jgi:hypothetical protein
MITKEMTWTIKNIIRSKGTELIEGLGSELKKNCWKMHRDERRVQNCNDPPFTKGKSPVYLCHSLDQ